MSFTKTLGPNGWEVGDIKSANISDKKILNAHKIERALTRLAQAGQRRFVAAWHGMSIVSGVGSPNAVGVNYDENYRLRSVAAMTGKLLAQRFGGEWAPGIDISISGFQTVTGDASFSNGYGSVGPNGRAALPNTGTIVYPVTNGRAGQVVKVYCLALPSATPSTPIAARYALSGANTQATTDAPISTGAPLAPIGSGHYYEFTITLANAGNTNIAISNPSSGGTIQAYFFDADYRTDAGVTIHRTAYTGTGITECCAWALDDTDTQPSGSWTTTGTQTQRQQRRQTQYETMTSRLGIDLALCSFSVNDIVKATTYGYSLASQERHIMNYVNKLNGDGIPVLIVEGFLRDPASVAATDRTQLDIIDMYHRVSDQSDNTIGASFIDLSSNIYGETIANKYAAQWRDPLFGIASENPKLHPAQFGHSRHANVLSDGMTDAASNL